MQMTVTNRTAPAPFHAIPIIDTAGYLLADLSLEKERLNKRREDHVHICMREICYNHKLFY